jgi:hypothetical protein
MIYLQKVDYLILILKMRSFDDGEQKLRGSDGIYIVIITQWNENNHKSQDDPLYLLPKMSFVAREFEVNN